MRTFICVECKQEKNCTARGGKPQKMCDFCKTELIPCACSCGETTTRKTPTGKGFRSGKVLYKQGHVSRRIDVKQKISKSVTDLHASGFYIGKTIKGIKLSEEIKKRRSANPLYRINGLKSRQAQNRKQGPNGLELKLYEYLTELDLSFEAEKIINNRFLVDAYIPKLNKVIEAFGCYWHDHTTFVDTNEYRWQDRARINYLTKCGYTVEVIWECEFGLKTNCKTVATI